MTATLFRRIAIVNRGEAAMRLINAARELKDESGFPLTVALHTEAEAGAMFVREADETVQLSAGDGNRYLDYAALEEALIASRADAAWVGWGFVAEHPEFAELCARLNITFVGPTADVMRRLGDKIGAKKLAETSGVPVAPWSNGPVSDLDQAKSLARTIGYPLMIKAAAGGGGRGIRRVNSAQELGRALERATSEAERSFGDGTVFMEPVITEARHVEVQVAADNYGNVWALGVRDCSLQRRNQKVIEESSSPALTSAQEAMLRDAATSLAAAAGYRNLGTVEFLYQPETGKFAFLEVNTRLQVEHPVTEETTRFDLVKLQLRIAAGWEIGGAPPAVDGHAIEARLNAEDPARGFAPAPGRISLLEFPTGPGIRVDTGVAEGDVIPADYDAMIAKIIAWGRDRAEAMDRLRRALEQTRVVIAGGTTNKSFLLDILKRPEVQAGNFTTAWLDQLTEAGAHIAEGNPAVALITAAIDAYEIDIALGQVAFYASALRGRPQLSETTDGRFAGRINGESYQVDVGQVGPSTFTVSLDGFGVEVDVQPAGRSGRILTIGENRFRVLSSIDGVDHVVEVGGVAHRVSRDDGGTVRAPAPALVVAVSVTEGDVVAKGAPLLVLESMKVETSIQAPFDAKVLEVAARANTQVDVGAPLIRLEPQVDADAAGTPPTGTPVSFGPLRAAAATDSLTHSELAQTTLAALHSQVLGYERSADSTAVLIGDYVAARANVPEDDTAVLDAEMGLLAAFADITRLSRNRSADPEEVDLIAQNPQEFFHRYLRSLDVDAEGLPSEFQERLLAAVSHFGHDNLDRTPAMERTAFGIFRSQQLVDVHIDIVVAILKAMPTTGLGLSQSETSASAELRSTLDRLIQATQLRYPAVGESARHLRFQLFDQPFIHAARVAELDNIRQHLAYLQTHPQAADRSEHIRDMVISPERLIGFFRELDAASRTGDAEGGQTALLEVITRRNYQTKSLERFRIGRTDNRLVLTVSFPEGDRRNHVLATAASVADFGPSLAALAEIAEKAPQTDDLVVDLYLRSLDATSDDELAALVGRHLGQVTFPPSVRRVTVSVADAANVVHHITMQAQDGTFVENRTIRGLHPTIAERLQVWRFEDFDVERLDSTADTYLFSAVGKDDPKDRRLFSAAEIRDLTPVRDEDGRIVALPEFEARLMDCLSDLRRQQSGGRGPQWNRVLLYVWPRVDIPLQDFDAIAQILAPATAGLGLEDVRVQAKLVGADGRVNECIVRIANTPESGLELSLVDVPTTPLLPIDQYAQTLQRARRRGAPYPYELLDLVTGADGSFIEYDLDETGAFGPVERPPGSNTAGIVVGLSTTRTKRYPEGMTRVSLFGDPTKALGSIAEPECRRILAGLELAELLDVPVEWFALSAGAKIAMDSGTENMDWISRVLRRIVEVTQTGREINVIVTGINVGAQPYWNAEATMLMHTRGILVMTPDSAMVLTGKEALDYSGGVSAEDNFGIGGHDRIMGPNGQAQYWAPDLRGAVDVLLRHYELSYAVPGERFPRRRRSTDPDNRNVESAPHAVIDGIDLTTVGDVFSDVANPGRKKPFDIRSVMNAVVDQDYPALERWAQMRDADNVVVYDAFVGGFASTVLGIESRPVQRHGLLPADGPEQWTAGTLFPLSSKKAARAINAASGNRPVLVLANLSGFDGSPESLAKWQLEYGAEIGRSVVNFDGPIVFCVISRYHGGAFVVFSRTLNDNMQILAVEGTKASVLGGAPAAAVVFTREVKRRVAADERLVELKARVASADGAEASALKDELVALEEEIRGEKLGEMADEFDTTHSIERAQQVGSIDEIIAPSELRMKLIAAISKGMKISEGSVAPAVMTPPVVPEPQPDPEPQSEPETAAPEPAPAPEPDPEPVPFESVVEVPEVVEPPVPEASEPEAPAPEPPAPDPEPPAPEAPAPDPEPPALVPPGSTRPSLFFSEAVAASDTEELLVLPVDAPGAPPPPPPPPPAPPAAPPVAQAAAPPVAQSAAPVSTAGQGGGNTFAEALRTAQAAEMQVAEMQPANPETATIEPQAQAGLDVSAPEPLVNLDVSPQQSAPPPVVVPQAPPVAPPAPPPAPPAEPVLLDDGFPAPISFDATPTTPPPTEAPPSNPISSLRDLAQPADDGEEHYELPNWMDRGK